MAVASFSDYFEAQILNWFKGTAFPTAPTNLFIGLFSANPADAGTSGAPQDGTEATGTSYARVSVAAATIWGAIAANGTAQKISTASAINFPTPGAGGWGTVTGIGIWDASTAGHLLAWCDISPTETISQGDTVTINSGNLTLSVE